jgi:hypothetical protein
VQRDLNEQLDLRGMRDDNEILEREVLKGLPDLKVYRVFSETLEQAGHNERPDQLDLPERMELPELPDLRGQREQTDDFGLLFLECQLGHQIQYSR